MAGCTPYILQERRLNDCDRGHQICIDFLWQVRPRLEGGEEREEGRGRVLRNSHCRKGQGGQIYSGTGEEGIERVRKRGERWREREKQISERVNEDRERER